MKPKKNISKKTTDAVKLRSLAEAKLSERKKKKTNASAKAVDSVRLVHELEVHQIELEMQNEELIHSRAELEAALVQYTDLYDFAPVGYFTLTRDGVILQANLAGADLLGVVRSKLIKQRLGAFVSDQSRVDLNEFLEKVFVRKRKETYEVSLLKDGNELLWVHIEAICDALDGQREHEICHAVVSDITGRVQAEEAFKQLSIHDSLTGLYNRSFFVAEMERLEGGRQFPVSIVMADVDRLKYTNDHFGHTAGDLLLKRVARVLTTTFRSEDVVARIGGDEFAVLLPVTDATASKILLQRVRQIIQEDNTAHPETLIQLSIGVSTAEHFTTLSVMLKMADENMYREKRERNGT